MTPQSASPMTRIIGRIAIAYLVLKSTLFLALAALAPEPSLALLLAGLGLTWLALAALAGYVLRRLAALAAERQPAPPRTHPEAVAPAAAGAVAP
jgi:hypothetical protein